MRICVLLPDYSTSSVDYQHYDPPRNLSRLLPDDQVDTVFLNKLTTYKQLKALQHRGYDIFVNLCEGYLEWTVPSIDVIYTLELLKLPFTGPTSKLYDPSKELMKYVAYCADVITPAYSLLTQKTDWESFSTQNIAYPVFIKPAKAGDSLGIDNTSVVYNLEQLQEKSNSLFTEYDELLVEQYIAGREFTVMLAANPDGKTCTCFTPIEYVFPDGYAYKTYELKTSALHPNANIPCTDSILIQQLQAAAEKIFKGFNGVGYARLDFRMDASNTLYFLEINFTCSVFYEHGYEGSADYILLHDGYGQEQFLRHIIAEGIARHQRTQAKYYLKGNAIAGYGIFAKDAIAKGTIVFMGEGKSQRIITKSFVLQHWTKEQQLDFARYAYPINEEVYVLWDEHPDQWAPQNHSCDANTAFIGLNVHATRNIVANEELTLDYGEFLNAAMQPFQCNCGSSKCRGLITGKNENRITNERAGN